MKIMIVEDDPTIRGMIQLALSKWSLETVIVENFDHVAQCFIHDQPHLVIMDINLPSYDGFYWCQKIREISNVPVLFLSSRDSPMDVVMSVNMGGDDYIQKPFHMDVLTAKVNALLRRTYSYSDLLSNVFEHEGVMFLPDKGMLTYETEQAELTKTEVSILKILMQQKGTVVDRKKIMRHLWQDESFVDENTLTVNIVRLRKKLAGIGKDNWIVTKKGQGYMIP
ncbi:response regulator transcription factor [Paenibacillus lautus]|uniref:response regulator transcription factor n=1 Tax=Paenibacillus lautus TaxID=1401 RepID=UPI002DBA690D|nr:response regulator transcription factor [Paenibacillus lautus]MEC0258806.1 response regulator transcription factor [Paenibacillus lautus]